MCDPAIRVLKGGCEFFISIKLGKIGPEVDRAVTRRETSPFFVMLKTEARAIALSAKPSLVSRHNPPVKSLRFLTWLPSPHDRRQAFKRSIAGNHLCVDDRKQQRNCQGNKSH